MSVHEAITCGLTNSEISKQMNGNSEVRGGLRAMHTGHPGGYFGTAFPPHDLQPMGDLEHTVAISSEIIIMSVSVLDSMLDSLLDLVVSLFDWD